MISAFMSRPAKVLLITSASIAVAALATACGTQKISVPKSDAQLYHGAYLFNQRCSGCHTLSYAATNGSASNVRTREITNGPNFNVRCERPVTRVLYAIENGGFSGAIMPQNVVVGRQAVLVAEFVAKYAGRQAPRIPGAPVCDTEPIGTLPSAPSTASATAPSAASPAAGKTAFASSCGSCHTLAAAGTKGTLGPNLDVRLAADAKTAGMPLKSFISESISKPNAFIAPGYQPNIMPSIFAQTLSPTQLQAVISFLATAVGSGGASGKSGRAGKKKHP
jgi:cytochrome c551